MMTSWKFMDCNWLFGDIVHRRGAELAEICVSFSFAVERMANENPSATSWQRFFHINCKNM
jgi:hypothetical protein